MIVLGVLVMVLVVVLQLFGRSRAVTEDRAARVASVNALSEATPAGGR
jgi:hypothetical protein